MLYKGGESIDDNNNNSGGSVKGDNIYKGSVEVLVLVLLSDSYSELEIVSYMT